MTEETTEYFGDHIEETTIASTNRCFMVWISTDEEAAIELKKNANVYRRAPTLIYLTNQFFIVHTS